MYLYSVAGTFGSGKTTIITNTVREQPGAFAYVLNDGGAEVDGSTAADAAAVVTMTNGCFTCDDEGDLAELLGQLAAEGFRGAFIEGFGMVSGAETRSFLERSGYDFDIFALVDAADFERNKARYGELVETHVAAATSAICITRYPDGVTDLHDPALAEVLSFIEEYSSGIPVMLMPRDGVLTLEEGKSRPSAHACCNHRHDHDHGHHQHDHGHDHHHHDHGVGIIPYSFELSLEASVKSLEEALSAAESSGLVVRVKGATDGLKFDSIGSGWTEGHGDERSFLTLYASRAIDFPRELPGLWLLVHERQNTVSEAESQTLLRKDSVSAEETIREIEAYAAMLPSLEIGKNTPAGFRVETHPHELQMLKEIARRPSVEREWFPKAIEACFKYWLRAGTFLATNPDHVVPSDLAKNQMELGVSLAWWAEKGESYLPPSLMQQVAELRPADMVAQGVLALKRLNTNATRAYWQAEEVRAAARFGLKYGADRELMLRAIAHGISLAMRHEQRAQWESMFDDIRIAV